MKKKLLLIQLNEVNFHWLQAYINKGKLPHFRKFISENGIMETIAERDYKSLEPWIQWVSVYTGENFEGHKVFRLGDISSFEGETIFDKAKSNFGKVVAISPMNFDDKHRSCDVYLPDPWTDGNPTGRVGFNGLHKAVQQLVNDNSAGKVSLSSFLSVLRGIITYSNSQDYLRLIKMVLSVVKGKKWYKSIILDFLLSRIFIKEFKSEKAGFFSVFLNAGAHIQHHYMFNSSVYEGELKNPDWYLDESYDPLLDCFEEYDLVLRDILERKDCRIVLATGLTQVPYVKEKFYWRFIAHESFLRAAGIQFSEVKPRMTRDFLIQFCNESEKLEAVSILSGCKDQDGVEFFNEIEVRDLSLFVTLTYPKEVFDDTRLVNSFYNINMGIKMYLAFVAVKNGMHSSTGFYIDSEYPTEERTLPLEDLHEVLLR